MSGSEINVGIAYADPDRQVWLRLTLPADSTVRDAIERSGLVSRFPQIDLNAQKVGIFGKFVKLDTLLKQGDRVEIYRAITADPATVPRRPQTDDQADGQTAD